MLHRISTCSSSTALGHHSAAASSNPPESLPLLLSRDLPTQQKARTFSAKLAQSPGRLIRIPDQSLAATCA